MDLAPGKDGLLDQRGDAVAVLAIELVQMSQHGADAFDADRIGPGQRTARVVDFTFIEEGNLINIGSKGLND